MKRSIVVLGLAVLALPAVLEAQDTEWNRYTLEKIGGVFVRTEADAVCQQAGVTASSVQADAAVELLEADVDLLTEDEMLAHPGLPELKISLECVESGGGTIAFAVDLKVQQAAQMIRDNQVTLSEAVTWYTKELGVADAAGVQAALDSALKSRIAVFAEAYVAANPVETGSN